MITRLFVGTMFGLLLAQSNVFGQDAFVTPSGEIYAQTIGIDVANGVGFGYGINPASASHYVQQGSFATAVPIECFCSEEVLNANIGLGYQPIPSVNIPVTKAKQHQKAKKAKSLHVAAKAK